MSSVVKRMPPFRQIIRQRREELGLSLEEVAVLMGETRQFKHSLYGAEAGYGTFQDKRLLALADALRLDPVDLFYSLGRIAPELRGNARVLATLKQAKEAA